MHCSHLPYFVDYSATLLLNVQFLLSFVKTKVGAIDEQYLEIFSWIFVTLHIMVSIVS